MVKFVDDYKRVTAMALSFWMQTLGLAVLIVPEARYTLTGADTNPAFLWYLGVFLLLGGIVGRLVKQELPLWREVLRWVAVATFMLVLAWMLAGSAFAMSSLDGLWKSQTQDEVVKATPETAAPAGSLEAATLKIAVPFIAREEGKRNKAYKDVVGVWTICYGSTRGIRAGMTMTDAECTALLHDEVAEYRRGLHKAFTTETKLHRLTPERDTAYTSLAFNCGVRAISKSTATKRLNAGDIAGGCVAIGWWNKGGGRVIRGLVSRRKREQALCRKGL